ncbi:hypothetical protein [Virgibacillus sp. SK37]|nr:hypothetical protein [Virgibacillus sp. SK37]
MQNLLQLLQELKTPASEPTVVIVPIDDEESNVNLSYQLELKIND